ncbi:LysR family transcriptional regulator [Shewanella maritima]|uniref:LysR family transcriptional regulator n=1 Tax=Shewanella maritima TaxID=2520507 RepID=A0A411PKY5_9GAMM|nr:LysR family transcriptional regulator [Shewanella maritima]QBF84165.1 LysR family transcriptional regulator [Shewanella maritima]
MTQKPTLNQLGVFSAVMSSGSFSRAAEQLNTNQSTISTSIAKLKQDLGQELFIRQGRGIAPTRFAQSLYEQIKLPLAQLDDTLHNMSEFDPDQGQHKFVITAPEHMHWLLLNKFSELKPHNIEIFDQPDTDEALLDGLNSQRFDAMIDIMPPNSSAVESCQLFDSDFVIVCSQDHPRVQQSISQKQFNSESHAVLERTRQHLRSLHHFTNIDLSQRKVAYHGRSLFSNMLLCSQTELITAIPEFLARQFQSQLNLQLLPPPFPCKPITNYLIWLKKHHHDPAQKWLRSQLIEATQSFT